MYDLSVNVALVTGAVGEHGFGRAIAMRLAQEGADIIVNDVVQNLSGSKRPIAEMISASRPPFGRSHRPLEFLKARASRRSGPSQFDEDGRMLAGKLAANAP